MTRPYVKFSVLAKLADGGSAMKENRANYITAGKLWAEWDLQLDYGNRTDWKNYVGDLSYMKSINLLGNHEMSRPGTTYFANSWAIWTQLPLGTGIAPKCLRQYFSTGLLLSRGTGWPLPRLFFVSVYRGGLPHRLL
jgi:hypothetical protein